MTLCVRLWWPLLTHRQINNATLSLSECAPILTRERVFFLWHFSFHHWETSWSSIHTNIYTPLSLCVLFLSLVNTLHPLVYILDACLVYAVLLPLFSAFLLIHFNPHCTLSYILSPPHTDCSLSSQNHNFFLAFTFCVIAYFRLLCWMKIQSRMSQKCVTGYDNLVLMFLSWTHMMKTTFSKHSDT